MIKPTIGRVVWYHNPNSKITDQPWAAIVCYIHSDTLINLSVFDENGLGKAKESVVLYQGEGERPALPYAEWMPYQQGQAAKTEQLEKQLQQK
jgi:hypothetical protein